MTETPTPFPDSPYCRVRARVASIWADGPDDGTNPDWRPATGEKVTLTPSIGSLLLAYDVGGAEPIIVTVERVECIVDEEGWLTKADGRPVFIAPTDDPLMSVTGWTWTASFNGKNVVFTAPSGGVVNLALFVAAPATDDTKVWVEQIPELIDLLAGGMNQEDIEQSIQDYLANNPIEGVTAQELADAIAAIPDTSWGSLSGKPSEFPPGSHQHTLSDITDYSAPDLTGYSPVGHEHAMSEVTGLEDALSEKQPSGNYVTSSGFSAIELYPDTDSLPTTGTEGVLYVVPSGG